MLRRAIGRACHFCKSQRKYNESISSIFCRNYSETNDQANNSNNRPKAHTTMDEEEISHFNTLAKSMWDLDGPFKALHTLNSLRVPLIRDTLVIDKSRRIPKPLEGKWILDVGCGGGILAEPLARLGAFVVGIDASEENIKIAQAHMTKDPDVAYKIKYIHATVEDMSPTEYDKFDAVVASEVVEHVSDCPSFISHCCHIIRPGGNLVVTTLNKTVLAKVLGVFAAERILDIVPPGTHDWEKFISPEDLQAMIESNGMSTSLIHGMLYNPLNNKWSWTKNTPINYAMVAFKNMVSSESSSSSSDDEVETEKTK